MDIQKINTVNNIKFSSKQIIAKMEKKKNETQANSTEVASVSASAAIKAQNQPNNNSYVFLQDVDLPFLNLKGKLYMLPNGQKCLVAKKDGPCILKTFFKVGSMNEPDHLRGISHYIEHNLFNGSKNLKPTEFVTKVNQMGARYNASTGFVHTDYFIQSPLLKETDLENFIKIHADMLSKPSFAEDMLEKEKGPVISEIQMLADNPYNIATNVALKNLFGIKTTSSDLIGGHVDNIKNLKRDDVINFYNQNYNPKTALTVVIGDIDEKKTMQMLADNFKDFKAPEKLEQKHEILTPINQTIRQDLYSDNAQSSVIQLAFAGPANEKEKSVMKLLLFALTGYKYAKLSEEMKKLNLSINSCLETISNKKNSPSAVLFSTSTPNNNEEEILKLIYSKIHEMSYKPLKQDELDLIKKMIKNGTNYLAESNMDIASLLGSSYINCQNFDALKDMEKTLQSITPEDIMNVAKKFLDLNKVSISVVHPTKNKNISFKGKKFKPLDIKTYTTSNNAEIATLNSPKSKICSINFRFETSATEDKAGLAVLLSEMLARGTSLMPEKDFKDIEYKNNITRSTSVKTGKITIDYAFPKESVDTVLSNMHNNIYYPALTLENFEKAKQTIKNSYYSAPKSAVDKALETLYPNSEKGFSARKAVENLDNITFNDVVQFYNKRIQNAALKIAITGDLSDDTLLNKVNSFISSNNVVYSSNNSHSVQCSTKPQISVADLPKTQIVTDVQERNQADIVQMFRFRETGNIKDVAAMKLLNEVLGGNSNSRLFNDLRETQKLAYKVNSVYSQGEDNESMLALRIHTTTEDKNNPKQSENLQKALNGFKKHIDKLINEKITQEELDAAKLQIKSKLLFELESTLVKNGILVYSMTTLYKQDTLKSLLSAIDAITVDDIQTIAKHCLDKPSAISIVASKNTIENNKDYLKSLGELK